MSKCAKCGTYVEKGFIKHIKHIYNHEFGVVFGYFKE